MFGKSVPVFAPLSRFGNMGAASALMELACSVLALQHGELPGTLNHENPGPRLPDLGSTPAPRGRDETLCGEDFVHGPGPVRAVVVKKWEISRGASAGGSLAMRRQKT